MLLIISDKLSDSAHLAMSEPQQLRGKVQVTQCQVR